MYLTKLKQTIADIRKLKEELNERIFHKTYRKNIDA